MDRSKKPASLNTEGFATSSEREDLIIADWLAITGEAAATDTNLSDDTRAELQRSLALAEAALRRASAEKGLIRSVKDVFRLH